MHKSKSIRDLLDEVIEKFTNNLATGIPEEPLPSGMPALDDLIGGLQRGHVHVIASGERGGKTSILLDMLLHLCVVQRHPSLVFAGGLPPCDLLGRMVYRRAKFPLDSHAAHGTPPTKADIQRIQRSILDIERSPLAMIPCERGGIASLRTRIHEHSNSAPVRFLAINDLHLFCDGPENPSGPGWVSSDSAMAEIHSLARELDLVVVATARLTREAERKCCHAAPLPSDLEGVGIIANHADCVGILRPWSREDGFKWTRPEIPASRFTLHVVKHPRGRTGILGMEFDRSYPGFEAVGSRNWHDAGYTPPSEQREILNAWREYEDIQAPTDHEPVDGT